MRLVPTTAILLSLAACGGGGGQEADAPSNDTAEAPSAPAPAPTATDAAKDAAQSWDLQSSGEGVALALMPAAGSATIRLFCPAATNRLVVNVPGFRPIGSEERLSFGSGGEVVALVADTKGDVQRGGVTGIGPVPDNLAALVGGRPAANYGAQTSGPHPTPPGDMARAFIATCEESAKSPDGPSPAPKPPSQAAACLMQGNERLNIRPLRAVGTEPFWGARIEGRCVTYSHPEDQDGTRIWTRYAKSGGVETWSGNLGGKPFTLRVRAQKDCSDGMSDKVYPLAADLIVNGEARKGCATPA